MGRAPELFGLVLSGGRSERMGTDKGWLKIHGISQRAYMFDLLSVVCHKVFTSCAAHQHIPSNLNPIVDRCAVRGALNGILSAFHAYPGSAFLAVAVDMPAISKQALRLLVAHSNSSKMATCFYNTAMSWPEPLLTIWEPSAYPALLRFCASNESPMQFLRTHDVCLIHAPSSIIFQNVNTPDELAKFSTNSGNCFVSGQDTFPADRADLSSIEARQPMKCHSGAEEPGTLWKAAQSDIR